MLTHLSLFSGIGGLDLAAEMAGFTTVGQCEIGEFQSQILAKHWPNVPRWRDINELSADEFIRRTGLETVTVISGGFPCQPHSKAGKRKASHDEREMWPQMRRVIREINPEWVVGENVRGILSSEHGEFFRGILRDFSDLGFNVAWCLLRASDAGALHNRERLALIAHTTRECEIPRGIQAHRMERRKQTLDDPYPSVEAWQRGLNEFESVLVRNVHGIPDWVDRINALGNAVVPQQFFPIFQMIAEMENEDES